MSAGSSVSRQVLLGLCAVVLTMFCIGTFCAAPMMAQSNVSERTFPQSKAEVERAVAAIRVSLAGHLPVLDGFAKPADHPLDHYRRGYYQTTVHVSSMPTGGSLVRVSTKVTAWYADAASSRSGYQLLTSNGRIEADLLDQIAEQLGNGSSEVQATVAPAPPKAAAADEPAISAPSPAFPATDRTFSSSISHDLAAQSANGRSPETQKSDRSKNALQAEADSLQEILKNTGHPKNLVAVKKSGTPVVANPSLTAKPEFMASMHDEFEMLDFNPDWVHVRISGLSRGWIWRNSVEIPEGIADKDSSSASAAAPAADLFKVIREEASTFPGTWEPLKNKNVKIFSVQNVDDNAKTAGAKARLEYTKFLMEKGYPDIARKPQDIAGIVVIFDSADGGMVAATTATLQQWKAGTLSDSALWHKCFFDPPETFDSAGVSASQ